MIHRLLLAITILTLTACATTPDEPAKTDGDSALMGLGDKPQEAVWTDWTPRAANQLVPQALADELVAFDYWQIADEEMIEDSWSSTAALLNYLRREDLPEGQEKTAKLLLQAFEQTEGAHKTRMDVTFVVSIDQEEPTEGLVVRIYHELPDHEVAPGVAIYLAREEGTPEGFERAVMWAQPGFEEADAFTVSLENTDIGWVAHKYDGTEYPTSPVAKPSLEDASELVSNIFQKRFWTPFTHSNFVEAKPRATEDEPTPAKGIEPSLGLDRRERQVEEVYKDTIFPPRMDTPPLGGQDTI